MARKKVTSSDVAERAGVSQATVSMVLNHKYNVSFSRETVEKVESAARELGYQLPGHKNKKENKKEKLIVVFCPTIQVPIMCCFFRELKRWRMNGAMEFLSVIPSEMHGWRKNTCV